MADQICVAQTAEVALSAATAKTVVQIAAASNVRVRLLGWGVFFDGTSNTAEPAQVRVLRQTTAGTMTSLTPAKWGTGSETVQTSAQHTATAEPTAGDVLDVAEVHPQGGFEKIFPVGFCPVLPGGGRVGIEVTAPAAVNVRAKLIFEE